MIQIEIFDYGKGSIEIGSMTLNIKSEPRFEHIVGLYHLQYFFEIDPFKIDSAASILCIEYLDYVIKELYSLDKKKFIIFDISDQYIGGFLIAKNNDTTVNIKYVRTGDIDGCLVHKENIEKIINEISPIFNIKGEWIFNYYDFVRWIYQSKVKIEFKSIIQIQKI